MQCWALVPIKPWSDAKMRLAPVLSPQRRARLATAMFEHVLRTARSCSAFIGVAVLSRARPSLPDEVLLLADTQADFNASLGHAVRELSDRGADCVAIVSADLPLLTIAELEALVDASHRSRLALAPDHHERGTNAVCLALPSTFAFQFGADSFKRHRAQASARGLEGTILRSPGFAFDVDEPDDLARLPARYAHGASMS